MLRTESEHQDNELEEAPELCPCAGGQARTAWWLPRSRAFPFGDAPSRSPLKRVATHADRQICEGPTADVRSMH